MDAQQQFQTQLSTLLDKLTLLSQSQLETQLAGYKPAEVHTIQYIGQHPEANVTQIAADLFVTRGAVSKLTRRLITRDLITRHQKPGNQKEIYFQLTPSGQAIYAQHEQLDNAFRKRDQPVFDQADPQQLTAVLDFLTMYNQHLDQQIQTQNQR